MSLPFFYFNEAIAEGNFQLNEETSKHISQVLRMTEGEKIQLTNGKGLLHTAIITAPHKKHTAVQLIKTEEILERGSKRIIAISPIKNISRFEWFLEKSTEIGIDKIILLNCARSEKRQYRFERMQNILISALIQSRQTWLPELIDSEDFNNFIDNYTIQYKYIAHCNDSEKGKLFEKTLSNNGDQIILIGPEGDFTEEEVKFATSHNYLPVSLGENRLRTETAGIAACLMMNLK